MGFQWHTDEDSDQWEQIESALPTAELEDPEHIEPLSIQLSGTTSWLWYLAMLCLPLLMGGGYLIYLSVDRYIDDQEQSEKANITKTFDLLIQANQDQDADILRTILSGRDLEWSGVQAYLLEQDLLLKKGFLNWESSENPTLIDISLSPDFLTAELQSSNTYTINSESIVLTQTHIFRRGAEQWLYAPLDDTYWGETITQTVESLTLIYPERDLEQIYEFVPILKEHIMTYCEKIGNESCHTYPITLNFSTDARHTLEIYEPLQAGRWLNGGERVITLPAIGLLGYPGNQTAETLLFQQYIIYILAAYHYDFYLVSESPISHALLNLQLQQLDLPPVLASPRPLRNSEIYSLAEMMKRWESVIDYPADPNGSWAQQAQTMVLFLADVNPDFDPFEGQNRLRDAKHNITWLTEMTNTSLEELEAQWVNHLRRVERMPSFSSPITEHLQASCQADGVMSLYSYEFDQDVWLLERPLGDSNQFQISYHQYPNGGYVIEQQGQTITDEWHTIIGSPSGTEFQFDNELADSPIFFTGNSSPDSHLWVATRSHPRFGFDETLLVDTQNCVRNGSCTYQEIEGEPIWSPNGQHTLFSSRNRLYLGDPQGQNGIRLERGFASFWLNNNQFGYLAFTTPRYTDGVLRSNTKLVLHDISHNTTETLIDEDLFPIYPAEISSARQSEAVLGYALSDPNEPLIYLLSAHEPLDTQDNERSYQLSVFNPENKNLQPLFRWDNFIKDISISPNGRWLTLINDLPQTEHFQTIWVFDTEQNRIVFEGMIATQDHESDWQIEWSQNDQRFAYIEGYKTGNILVYDTGSGKPYIIETPFESCTAVFWSEEKE